jgi:hypothetical protein
MLFYIAWYDLLLVKNYQRIVHRSKNEKSGVQDEDNSGELNNMGSELNSSFSGKEKPFNVEDIEGLYMMDVSLASIPGNYPGRQIQAVLPEGPAEFQYLGSVSCVAIHEFTGICVHLYLF